MNRHFVIVAALGAVAMPFAATAGQDQTAAPATAPAAAPTPAATPAPAPEAQAEPSTPFDKMLVAAKPMTADPKSKSAPARLTGSSTANCATQLSLQGGEKLTIDLKKMQPMAVNTNLMITGGGHAIQMEFDSKDGAKQAADAEKAISDMNDKCGA